MKHDFRPLRPLIFAAALCLAGAPALAQQSSSPDTIATSGQDRAANAGVAAGAAPAATAGVAPGTATGVPPAAATPEQQAALAGARPANAPAPSNVLATQAPSAAGSLVQTILSLGFVIA